jgi:hypothetical protein
MNKQTLFPPHLSRMLGAARTSEVAMSLSAKDAPYSSTEAPSTPVAKSSYRVNAAGEKIVRTPHALRFIHF